MEISGSADSLAYQATLAKYRPIEVRTYSSEAKGFGLCKPTSLLTLGRGLPLHPNVKGLIINYLRHELRPRELKLAPDELHLSEGRFSRAPDAELVTLC